MLSLNNFLTKNILCFIFVFYVFNKGGRKSTKKYTAKVKKTLGFTAKENKLMAIRNKLMDDTLLTITFYFNGYPVSNVRLL